MQPPVDRRVESSAADIPTCLVEMLTGLSKQRKKIKKGILHYLWSTRASDRSIALSRSNKLLGHGKPWLGDMFWTASDPIPTSDFWLALCCPHLSARVANLTYIGLHK